jgi:streptomycin 3"-adenylyltransferase
MTPLPAAIDAILTPFVADLRTTLGADLVGVYLYGSAVRGGFDPEASDFDVAVVVRPSTDDIDIERFDGLVRRLADRERAWADRLDVVFVGRPTLATFRSGGPLVAISHEDALQRFDDADGWLQTWFLIRIADTAIVGPPIAEVIGPIELAEFVEAVSTHTEGIVRSALEAEVRDGYLAYLLLTAARVACVRATGRISPKDDAGQWLAARRPGDAATIEGAIAVRHGAIADPAWRDAVRSLLGELVPFDG